MMKPSILNQMTWQDIREICIEAYLLHTIPEDLALFETPEEYYTEILRRLKSKAETNQKSARRELLKSYYGD